MDPRGALAKLFLAGRSPEEQQQRILQQRHDAGLSGFGGAFPSVRPDSSGGIPPDPMTTGATPPVPLPQEAPIPTPAPEQPYIPSIITGGAGPGMAPDVPIPTPRPIEAMGALPQEAPIPQLRGVPQNAPIPKPRPKKGKDGSLKAAAKKAGVSSQYALF